MQRTPVQPVDNLPPILGTLLPILAIHSPDDVMLYSSYTPKRQLFFITLLCIINNRIKTNIDVNQLVFSSYLCTHFVHISPLTLYR